MTRSVFGEYWSEFSLRSTEERRRYFNSLTNQQRQQLLKSFYEENWPAIFFRDMLDYTLLKIKRTYGIDLIDWRIKAVKTGKVFLVEKATWDRIEELTGWYWDYLDLTFLFGGIMVSLWGRNKQFYRIRSTRNKWR